MGVHDAPALDMTWGRPGPDAVRVGPRGETTCGRFLPEHTTAVALLDRLLHHAVTVVTSGDSYRMKEARTRGGMPIQRA
jgi:hypothetical protein